MGRRGRYRQAVMRWRPLCVVSFGATSRPSCVFSADVSSSAPADVAGGDMGSWPLDCDDDAVFDDLVPDFL